MTLFYSKEIKMRKIIKIILLAIVCQFSFFGFSQIESYSSFYFSEAQPSGGENIDEFDEGFFGLYHLEGEKHTKIKIENDSIIAKYLVAFELTKEEVNANENYRIENNLLYGVAPAGLHFIEENDTLLVALNQEELFCSPKNSVVKREGSTYFINKKIDEGKWTTVVLNFSGKTLEILNLNHIYAEKEINRMPKEIEMEGDLTVYVASPSDKDFFALVKSKGYRFDVVRYKKVN